MEPIGALRRFIVGRRSTRVRPAKTAIVWLTHFHDPLAEEAFARLAAEAAPWGHVVQVRNGTGDLSAESGKNVILLGPEEVAAACPARHAEKSAEPAGKRGYADLIYMAVMARLPAFEHVWILEYDADFSGHWGAFFTEFTNCSADLLGAAFYPRALSLTWAHWKKFQAPPNVDPNFHTRGFFPVARLSARFRAAYLEEVRKGWRGHCEAIWPSIALFRGLAIEDIGGEGPFVPPARRGRLYTGTDDPKLRVGTFRFRPRVAKSYHPASDAEFPPNHLCHPVKTAAYRAVRLRRKKQLQRAQAASLNRFFQAERQG
jgi:hypothetical protein